MKEYWRKRKEQRIKNWNWHVVLRWPIKKEILKRFSVDLSTVREKSIFFLNNFRKSMFRKFQSMVRRWMFSTTLSCDIRIIHGCHILESYIVSFRHCCHIWRSYTFPSSTQAVWSWLLCLRSESPIRNANLGASILEKPNSWV